MIEKFLKIVDSQAVVAFRLTLLTGVCFFLFLSVAFGWQNDISQANLRGMERVANEHRFSVLETDMSMMKGKLEDLSFHSYLQLLALSGIIGETGIRVLKGKKTT